MKFCFMQEPNTIYQILISFLFSCILHLSRKEMYTAFPIILDRLKNMRFAEKNDFNYSPNVLLRGLDSLNIEFDK